MKSLLLLFLSLAFLGCSSKRSGTSVLDLVGSFEKLKMCTPQEQPACAHAVLAFGESADKLVLERLKRSAPEKDRLAAIVVILTDPTVALGISLDAASRDSQSYDKDAVRTLIRANMRLPDALAISKLSSVPDSNPQLEMILSVATVSEEGKVISGLLSGDFSEKKRQILTKLCQNPKLGLDNLSWVITRYSTENK